MEEVLKNEPWFMRNLATICITENQESKLDEKVRTGNSGEINYREVTSTTIISIQAETFEKVLRLTNNKAMQTDLPLGRKRTTDIGTDPHHFIPADGNSSDSSLAMVTAIDESLAPMYLILICMFVYAD